MMQDYYVLPLCKNLKKEIRFHPDRRWRFDYACTKCRLAIEVEGGIHIQGRHVRGAGYEKDLEKYNAAVILNWKVLRYTPQQLRTKKFMTEVESMCQKYDSRMLLKNARALYVSRDAVELIKAMEGLRLERYKDAAGYDTIGYGHRLKENEDYKTITEEQAEQLLRQDILQVSEQLTRVLEREEVQVTQEMFDALVSFVYNVGIGAFEKSTMLKKLKKGDYKGAAEEFDRWVFATVGGKKKKLRGLAKRRQKEKELFLRGLA